MKLVSRNKYKSW